MKIVFKITELFTSFEGEGIRTGELAFFIRLFGCNLDCTFCDSHYAHKEGNPFTEMTLEAIVSRAKESGCENITITGGEPLIHENIGRLIKALSDEGSKVNIETNGSIDIDKIQRYKGMFFTADYKCPYSGMTDKMRLANLEKLTSDDVLKFVVSDRADLEEALRIIKTYKPKSFIYLSPVYGKIEASEIAEFMKEHMLTKRIRLQLQLHKYVYPPQMRGV